MVRLIEERIKEDLKLHLMFQFQNGSINSDLPDKNVTFQHSFNSKMVRLIAFLHR